MTELEFISINRDKDPTSLRLKYSGKDTGFDIENAIMQIEARKKCSNKLKNILKTDGFRFPSLISAEQATDEKVAEFHASLCEGAEKIIDMTAGLGIDAVSLAAAEQKRHIDAFEIDAHRAECLEGNVCAMNLESQINVINADCCEYIRHTTNHYDLLFADPARRGSGNKRLYALSECTPDLTAIMDDIYKVSDRFIFKVSPMLDVTEVIREIPGIESIYAVSLKGELKELLISGKHRGELNNMISVIIHDDNDWDEFEFSPEVWHLPAPLMTDADSVRSGMYLYEPDASIMKFGCWGALSARFPGLIKASVNTSLFISEWEYLCFPGRITRIESILTGRDIKKLKGVKINVVTRNYPVKAEELKKKIAAKDGGDEFVYGLRVGNKPMLLKTIRI